MSLCNLSCSREYHVVHGSLPNGGILSCATVADQLTFARPPSSIHANAIAQARSTLARWRAQAAGHLPSYFFEWGRVLEGSPEKIVAFASMREDATRLRQSSPFTNLLMPFTKALRLAGLLDLKRSITVVILRS
jgi:hypothetical protein